MLTGTLYVDRDKLLLTLAGHAGAGKKGEDIVCAAASILAYTAAQEVLRLHREGSVRQPPKVKLTPGSALVETENCPRTAMIFQVVATGFSLLSAQYPRYVKWHRKEDVL